MAAPSNTHEGRAVVEVTADTVFFSPHQVLQRDLTVLLLQHFSSTSPASPCRILDALSGSGIRAIRYALEVPHVHVVANDMDADAVAHIRTNAARNGLASSTALSISHADAIDCMWIHRGTFDVIDLDPFGPCAALLASAIPTIAIGGLVCATDTDLQTLLGKTTHSHAQCFAQYGATPVTAAFGKELAVRLVLACADRIARAYDRRIVPVLGTTVEYFVRIYFRVYESESNSDGRPPRATVAKCIRCQYFDVRPLDDDAGVVIVHATCPACGSPLQMGGPFWTGPLHDRVTLDAILEDARQRHRPANNDDDHLSLLRAVRHVQSIQLEHRDLDMSPLYFSLPKLFRPFKQVPPPHRHVFTKALAALGFRTSSTHFDPMAFKTNATAGHVYGLVAAWLRQHGYDPSLSATTAADGHVPRLIIPQTTSVSFATASTLQSSSDQFAPPIKCLVDHMTTSTRHDPPPPSMSLSGHTWHIHESTREAIEAALAQAQPDDTLVLHGHTYNLGPLPLCVRTHGIAIVGAAHPGPSVCASDHTQAVVETKVVGHVVVVASNVALRHLHLHWVRPAAAAAAPPRVHVVSVVGVAHVLLDSCRVSCGQHAPALACIGVADRATHVVLRACQVHDGPQAGLFVTGKSEVVADCCTFRNLSGAGIDVQGGSECRVVRSSIADCRKSGLFVHAFGVMDIHECVVDRNGMAGIEVATHASVTLRQSVICRGRKGGLLVHSSGCVVDAVDNVFARNALASVDVRGMGSFAQLTRNHMCNGRASGVYVSDQGSVRMRGNYIAGHKRAGVELTDDVDGRDEADLLASQNELVGNGCPTTWTLLGTQR
ncbi:Aste57867_15139 [Aphanomyces stellatus]|uniref:tRNA (guanine(26)-N(2))-dimethyltransferase n=1 Tax=Aphanomyces stellatus TaxID=120398 RepID=A0A485L2G4_9STRA|nr:hypothetical protein As57867_015083 [Aphanomyces stellatus]VFT91948.1 Aste57867_15139 [Aphanomyces stellatus]